MDNQDSFTVSDRNRIRRIPERGHYDRATVYEILDQCWIGHLGLILDQSPTVIPMAYGRIDDHLILHGARSSRLMQTLSGGAPVCLSAAVSDGLVLAKSLFHHSMNYRSVVVFGTARAWTDPDRTLLALKAVSDKLMPGRWEDARLPNPRELAVTSVVAIEIESASAKVRQGGPKDDREDFELPYWSGVIPIQMATGPAIPAAGNHCGVPSYIDQFMISVNSRTGMT